ncbi:MAG TPA: hypothetical protein P5277_04375 [Candidatus Paceibacterota bacterium]|nr:hypothetical protein [Candidatus Paceibacterota bacterium]
MLDKTKNEMKKYRCNNCKHEIWMSKVPFFCTNCEGYYTFELIELKGGQKDQNGANEYYSD